MEIKEQGRIVEVDGKKFAKLSPNQRAQLLSEYKAVRHADMKALLKELNTPRAEFFNELDAHSQSHYGDTELIAYTASAVGASKVLVMAYQSANQCDEAAAKLAIDELFPDLNEAYRLIAILTGIKLVTQDLAYAKRQQYKQDLADAGVRGEDALAKLEAFDAANNLEPGEPDDRPLAPAS